jgi:hypothetical protein
MQVRNYYHCAECCREWTDVWSAQCASRRNRGEISQSLHFPLAAEAGKAGFSREKLLHGGLFEVTLLLNVSVKPIQ